MQMILVQVRRFTVLEQEYIRNSQPTFPPYRLSFQIRLYKLFVS